MKTHSHVLSSILLTFIILNGARAFYSPVKHAPLKSNAIAVYKAGSYAIEGATYQLVNDISSTTSPIFLGKNITLDLNGYTIRFADGNYENIPNYDFEHGLTSWDISKAPSAKTENDNVHVFTGKHIVRLSAGEEIVSEYITLPVAKRSYFAMCGVCTWKMKVSLFIEDENGASVQCFNSSLDSVRQCCPMINRSPRLGGGFVTAHLFDQPTGKYRVRVRAETDCLIDHVDLRPAMDVGISIIDNTNTCAHNDDLHNGLIPAFFDFTKPESKQVPLDDLPKVIDYGLITIKNGVIKSEALGVLSWGIQSTARDAKIFLDNVKIESSGINTNAVDAPSAKITNCLFQIDTPFIINRHVSEHAVVLRGPAHSKVSDSEFFGGQGCLTIKGGGSDIFNNLFVNRQTVTNHYSVMAMGDGSKIHNNIFRPEIGSGVEIFRHKMIQIYENEFHIEAAPPTCEYGHEEYSTTAIRVADYDAGWGSERGCWDNHIFRNKFFITGKDYPDYPDYIPMAWAFFHSVSGGETHIYDNDIIVNHTAPDSKAEAAAIYIGGSEAGGVWTNNRITTNVPAAWIASRYGDASNATFCRNTITMTGEETIKPFRIGWHNTVANNIHFDSNFINNAEFDFDVTDRNHNYIVSWTLTLHISNKNNNPAARRLVIIRENNGEKVSEDRTDHEGYVQFHLKEYKYHNHKKQYSSPYSVHIGEQSWSVTLEANKKLELTLE